MNKIIINADDCGISKEVDNCIKHFIDLGKLSSTTIMANMDDFEGAIQLYEEYNEKVSFGIHLNMTQGVPLLNSQILLDNGIIIEDNGRYRFSGYFPYKWMRKEVRQAVKVELQTQISKICDNGVIPSHIDGHHHIHTYPSMISVTSELLKNNKINRVRRMRNYFPGSFQYYMRSVWLHLIRIQVPNVKSSHYFAGLKEFFSAPVDNSIIELMCHPGGYDPTEYEYMNKLVMPENIELISYNNI